MPSTRSRVRLRTLIAVAAVAGALFYRNAFATLQTLGWGAWPLSLLLCVLAAAAWQGALLLARPSRTVGTHEETSDITVETTASNTRDSGPAASSSDTPSSS